MTKLSERIGNRIKERRDSALGSIEVEEWGETLHFKPMSAGDVSRMQRKYPTFLEDANMEAMIDLMILKCLDDDGDKAFDLGDKQRLKTEDVQVIAKISSEIMATRTESDIEGN